MIDQSHGEIMVDKCQQIRYDKVNKILKDLWCLTKENRESGENPERTHHCEWFCFCTCHWKREGAKTDKPESGDLPLNYNSMKRR